MTDNYLVESENKWNTDVSVLLIFLNRPGMLSKVFDQVKIARPRRLFLYQDGARNEKDMIGVEKCREVVENIDWNCEVYRFYQDKNCGCDPSEYISQRWAFGIVDKCIVLEDDDVPSQSFFIFCKELLDKYEYDERINIISGMNHFGVNENADGDYFFTYNCSISGWASWSRVVNRWDKDYAMFRTKQGRKKLKYLIKNKYNKKFFFNLVDQHIKSGREHYESILIYDMIVNNAITIVPKYNMISNIGNATEGGGGTHGVSNEKLLVKAHRQFFSAKTYDIDFPMKHPNYVVDDYYYRKKMDKVLGRGHPFLSLFRRFESVCLRIRYEKMKGVKHYLKKIFRIKK